MTASAQHGTALFSILRDGPALSGLARIAAEGLHAEDGHLTEFRTLKVRSILNRSVSRRQLRLDLSINPYRGCEFGCRYCYARYTHTFFAPGLPQARREDAMGAAAGAEPGAARVPEADAVTMASAKNCADSYGQEKTAPDGPDFLDPATFERLIFMKQNAAWLLEQELRAADPELEIALGTATDPYQPIERRALITRSILEVFARQRGRRLGLVTKSALIVRDIELLRTIARENRLVVHITITTPDAELARRLEPRAPRPDLRLRAVRRLREAGIETGVLCSPLLPGITDSEEAIDAMARHAAVAGASFFSAQPLFLKPCSRGPYLGFVHEHFPELVEEYERRFGAAEFAAPPYRRQLALAVARACRRYGLRPSAGTALLTREMGRPGDGAHAKDAGRLPPRKGPHRVGIEEVQQSLFG